MKKTKYAYGTPNNSSVKNYIKSPSEAIAESQINSAKAQYAGATDPLANILGILGQATMQFGANMPSPTMAYGGKTNSSQVEVEGEETLELPNGKTKKMKGPSHENGGIDINLPDNTLVFSDRISVDGKTMAQRKDHRQKKIARLEKKLKADNTDELTRASYERMKTSFDKEQESDLKIQELFSQGQNKSFALGGITGINEFQGGVQSPDFSGLEMTPVDRPAIDLDFGGSLPSVLDKLKEGLSSSGLNLSGGDALSLGGDLFSAFAPYFNTLANRAGDTPNINAYEGFGEDALDTIDSSKAYSEQQKASALGEIDRSTISARKRGRNSARGVNTQRALDLASEQSANRAKNEVYDMSSKQMMAILNQQAQLENARDNVVMGGEQNRDLADRADRDAFFTEKNKGLETIGRGVQQIGKNLNQKGEDKVLLQLLKDMFENGMIDKNGNITKKEG